MNECTYELWTLNTACGFVGNGVASSGANCVDCVVVCAAIQLLFIFTYFLFSGYAVTHWCFHFFTGLLLWCCVSFCSLFDGVCLSGNKRIRPTYLLTYLLNQYLKNMWVLDNIYSNVKKEQNRRNGCSVWEHVSSGTGPSTIHYLQLPAPRYGTTCRLTSQLRCHSRSSDNALRHFCSRAHTLTLSLNL